MLHSQVASVTMALQSWSLKCSYPILDEQGIMSSAKNIGWHWSQFLLASIDWMKM